MSKLEFGKWGQIQGWVLGWATIKKLGRDLGVGLNLKPTIGIGSHFESHLSHLV